MATTSMSSGLRPAVSMQNMADLKGKPISPRMRVNRSSWVAATTSPSTMMAADAGKMSLRDKMINSFFILVFQLF